MASESIARRILEYHHTYPLIHVVYDEDRDLVVDSPVLMTPLSWEEENGYQSASAASRARKRRNSLYIPEIDGDVDFNSWLECYRPSQTRSIEDDTRRIAVLAQPAVHEFRHVDPAKVKADWAKFQESGKPINGSNIQDLACNLGITSGKWMWYPSTGLKVDHFWSIIATALVEGRLGPSCTGVKVTTFEPERRHTICVYHKNYTDHSEVLQVEGAIRATGLKANLNYKPDIHTYLGIYGLNSFDYNLSSLMYSSYYDIKAKRSVITELKPTNRANEVPPVL